MSLDPVSAVRSAPPSAAEARAPKPPPTPAEVARAAQQFEAILVRQLLAPSIEPIMSGGSGAGAGGGGSTYAFMITDMLADNIARGGGLGLASVISRQLQPAAPAPAL